MLKYNFQLAKTKYLQGKNVMGFLKNSLKIRHNTSEIIETAYDLQAGTYINYAKNNWLTMEKISRQCAAIIKKYACHDDNILDIGTGELTSLYFLMNQLNKTKLSFNFYACDISLSRLMVGRDFISSLLPKKLYNQLEIFCADIFLLPVLNKSIDIVTSYHALEPNGGQEELLLKEIFRVCRKKAILFEPSYELNSNKGKARMDRHGYIKNLPKKVEKIGGKLEDLFLMENHHNDLNLTAAYIISPPHRGNNKKIRSGIYADPGENTLLNKKRDCFYSQHYGVAYPIINKIPILKEKYAIIASAMSEAS